MNNKFLKLFILYYFIFEALFILMLAFAALEFNPLSWSPVARFFFAAWSFIGTTLIAGVAASNTIGKKSKQ